MRAREPSSGLWVVSWGVLGCSGGPEGWWTEGLRGLEGLKGPQQGVLTKDVSTQLGCSGSPDLPLLCGWPLGVRGYGGGMQAGDSWPVWSEIWDVYGRKEVARVRLVACELLLGGQAACGGTDGGAAGGGSWLAAAVLVCGRAMAAGGR
jgi:hypothetical protein